MDSETYLFNTFFDFLAEHSTDEDFNNNDMRKYDCKIDDYTNQYNLTDFGVAYFKVYLGIAIYPLYSPEKYITLGKHSENVTVCKHPEHIREKLETRKIQIMRYRP